eukprot:3021387-Prymnesium_polylepis.1
MTVQPASTHAGGARSAVRPIRGVSRDRATRATAGRRRGASAGGVGGRRTVKLVEGAARERRVTHGRVLLHLHVLADHVLQQLVPAVREGVCSSCSKGPS